MSEQGTFRLLDVGCGDASLASAKDWPDEFEYTGLEINERLVTNAQRRGLDVRQHDVTEGLDSFTKNEFDFVVAKAILEHVNDPLSVVEECYRVCAGNGRFVAVVPTDRSYDLWGDYEHVRAFRRDALYDLLRDAGFDVLDISGTMAWKSIGQALKDVYRIAVPWTPYGYPRTWIAQARPHSIPNNTTDEPSLGLL